MTDEERKEWKQLYGDKIGEYYPWPEIHCHCPLNCRIKIQYHHRYTGVPEFINGHNNRGRVLGPHTEETIEKMRQAARRRPPVSKATRLKISQRHLGRRDSNEAIERKRKARMKWLSIPGNLEKLQKWTRNACWGKLRGDITKEAMRFGKGTVVSGPIWYVYTSDFINFACYVYGLKHGVVNRRVKKILKMKGLTKLDLLLFLNFICGHNQYELSQHFHIEKKEVSQRLIEFGKQFPTVFQESISFFFPDPKYNDPTIMKWMEIIHIF